MVAKKKIVGKTNPTGVNKGIEKGVATSQFEGRVICKKCGKDIEFTLGTELHRKCPRCGAVVERNIKHEEHQAGKIIKWDILRRSKKTWLLFGLFLAGVAVAYNIAGFFTCLFADGRWWLALMSIPFIVGAYFCIRVTRKKSASGKYKFFAWTAGGVLILAAALVVVTAIPELSEKVKDLVNR